MSLSSDVRRRTYVLTLIAVLAIVGVQSAEAAGNGSSFDACIQSCQYDRMDYMDLCLSQGWTFPGSTCGMVATHDYEMCALVCWVELLF